MDVRRRRAPADGSSGGSQLALVGLAKYSSAGAEKLILAPDCR